MTATADKKKRRNSHSLRLRAAIAVQRRLLGKAQEARRSQFRLLQPPRDAVVFLGDSITEGGSWNEWFPQHTTINRGIGGETSAQVLERLQDALDRPATVVLLIGTNDLALGYPIDEIVNNVRAIVRGIQSAWPECVILLQSVMPRGKKWQQRVTALNRELRNISAETHIEYVDLWPALEGNEGALKPEYTSDELHLTGAGYRAWRDVLEPYISRI